MPWEANGLAGVLPGTGLRRRARPLGGYVEWSSEGDPLPALAEALDLVRSATCRPSASAVLLWGDVRLGNLVFDPERRVARRARLGPGLARAARRWIWAGTSGSSS